MDIKKSRPVRFRVSEREGQQLDALCDRNGKRSSEMWRMMLAWYFHKTFPKYAEKKGAKPVIEEPELTPEQACEQAGGKVVTKDGVQMCELKLTASMKRYVPLSKPELFKK